MALLDSSAFGEKNRFEKLQDGQATRRVDTADLVAEAFEEDLVDEAIFDFERPSLVNLARPGTVTTRSLFPEPVIEAEEPELRLDGHWLDGQYDEPEGDSGRGWDAPSLSTGSRAGGEGPCLDELRGALEPEESLGDAPQEAGAESSVSNARRFGSARLEVEAARRVDRRTVREAPPTWCERPTRARSWLWIAAYIGAAAVAGAALGYAVAL